MKKRKIIVFGSIVFVMLYFLGCSPIRRFLTSKGMIGIIAFFLGMFVLSLGVFYLIEKHAKNFCLRENCSARSVISWFGQEFRIERKDMIMLGIIVLFGAVLRFMYIFVFE